MQNPEAWKYWFTMPQSLLQAHGIKDKHDVIETVFTSYQRCCKQAAEDFAQLLQSCQSISASSAYSFALLKVDWQQETHFSLLRASSSARFGTKFDKLKAASTSTARSQLAGPTFGHWIQKYPPLTSKYLENNIDKMFRLTKSVNAINDLRLSYQQGLRNGLDSLGDLCHRTTRAISIPTISANRLLPQKSVWSFRKRATTSGEPSPAEHTTAPALTFLHGPRQALE